MIVVDASVLVTALGDDGPDGASARERIVGERLVAPHLVDVEITAAWRRLASRGHLDATRAVRALEDLADLRLERVPHTVLVARCWELREDLTTYDAVYVALAEHIGVTLVTFDRRLVEAPGIRCHVEVPA